jgi:outer membrane lipoprotein-sorting protein
MLAMRAQHGRRPFLSLVPAIVAALVAGVTLAADTPRKKTEQKTEKTEKADLFDEIYQRSQPIVSSLKTIRARFTETTTSSLLATPLVAEGTLVAVRPADLFITYTKPDRKIVRMDAKKLLFIWPERHLRQESDIEQAQKRVQHYFVDKSPDELRKHFTIRATEDAQKPGTYLVALTPTRKQIKEGVSRIDLWIDKASMMLSSMRMTFPNGDTKTMALHDVEVNPPVDLAALDRETH